MKRGSPNRTRALGLLVCAAALAGGSASLPAQTDQSQTAQLLGKAHALEVRGRMDMARQTWQQVLLVDPNNTDALAGMARAAKLEGNQAEAETYLNKLRAINPNDPNIARVQNMGTAQDTSAQLQEAGRLAQAGQYARAMTILRSVYGNEPPPGDAALSYYQTEAATEDGRPHAIAGLRALMDKYPQDSRYQIALGKILTYNPRTRAEGRKLLARHPNDPDAQEALRQSLVWDAQNPGTAPDIKAYLSRHKDEQLQQALAQDRAQGAAARRGGGGRPAVALTPEQQAAQAAVRARSAEVQRAYDALNAKHIEDADARFKAVLEKNPHDWQALAGLGYVRMNQSNFGGAISYFQQAEQEGAKDPAVERALRDSRFFFTMQEATTALNENSLVAAEQGFNSALKMRPNDPTALLGLGGTLLKAQQNERAMAVFTSYVKLAPGDRAAWRGLFMAQYGAGHYQEALATDRRVPPAVKRELMRDPDYLRTLASTYLALGRDADAQRVLKSALDLPFPPGGRGLKADVQLQYAALLSTANRHEQAIGLYRQVLATDSTNPNAWIGLVQNLHAEGHEAEAYQAIESMPPQSYAAAMQDAGFETTVAAVFENQNRDDLAQQVLERFLAQQQAEGKKPFVPAQVQLAGIYMRHGDSARAYPLYGALLQANPNNADAWNGLLGALHSTGHDREAIAQLQQIPPATRVELEKNPNYLATVGSIYAGVGENQQAMVFFSRVQQHYAAQHVAPPADIDVQEAWLLYNSGNDGGLYRQLMRLGSRQDLTDQQRLTVQTIWANWAVRRANQASAHGDNRRAIAILNAAARSFPNNNQVLMALASGYASAGMPKEAVAIFRAQNMSAATADEYKAAVGAALSANDLRDAETWLRFGLDQYPRDWQMLRLAAKFEQARGDSNRAAEYYKASLALMPAADPGSQLADFMSKPAPVRQQDAPVARQPQDLASLLAQPDHYANGTGAEARPLQVRPYLPSYSGPGTAAPVPMSGAGAAGESAGYNYGTSGAAMETGNSPDLGGGPTYAPQAEPSRTRGSGSASPRNSTLQEYRPQSRVDAPANKEGAATVAVSTIPMPPGSARELAQVAGAHAPIQLKISPEMEAKYGPYVPYDPSEGVIRFRSAATEIGDGVVVVADSGVLPGTTARLQTASFAPQQAGGWQPAAGTATAADGTPIVGYVPNARPRPSAGTQPAQTGRQGVQAAQETPAGQRTQAAHAAPANATNGNPQGVLTLDGPAPLVSGSHAGTRRAATGAASRSTAMSARAAAIRANQAAQAQLNGQTNGTFAAQPLASGGGMRGVSRPPADDYSVSAPSAAEFNNAQYYTPAGQRAQPPAGQMGQTTTTTTTTSDVYSTQQGTDAGQGNVGSGATRTSRRSLQNGGVNSGADAGYGAGNTAGATDGSPQQYPQPMTGTAPPSDYSGGRVAVRRARRSVQTSSQSTETTVQQPAMSYPSAPAPLENSGYPQIGSPYPLGQPPSDYELQQRNIPPLRGYFDPRIDDRTPLTPRQQNELDLASIEGATSGWVGGSVIGRYRSGTAGLDRLTDLTVPFEVSAVVANSMRLTLVAKAVFLNSGQLDTTTGALGTNPVLGTLPGTTTTAPAQQFASGVGGEVQLATGTFAAAIGTTPWNFLVSNVIGRVRWRPANGHFTLYGGRDAVTETQLSYAGLRDPGNASATFGGPVWGGVVATGGGVRFDAGDEHSGLYVQMEGAALTGYHVLDNTKFDGTMGAYFRVKTWPEYGSLNVGGTFFGEHFAHNERGETYGLGGYFSPEAYFLAAVPVTFNGHSGTKLHYVINAAVGVQTFQEDNQVYFPLDPANMSAIGCTYTQLTSRACGLTVNSNTGLNFSVDGEMSYQVNEHWFVGGFLSANNTNNYDTVTGGFFARYTFRPQYPTVDYPTGLFPVEGFRPLRVP